jgi:hypothetical protein
MGLVASNPAPADFSAYAGRLLPKTAEIGVCASSGRPDRLDSASAAQHAKAVNSNRVQVIVIRRISHLPTVFKSLISKAENEERIGSLWNQEILIGISAVIDADW